MVADPIFTSEFRRKLDWAGIAVEDLARDAIIAKRPLRVVRERTNLSNWEIREGLFNQERDGILPDNRQRNLIGA